MAHGAVKNHVKAWWQIDVALSLPIKTHNFLPADISSPFLNFYTVPLSAICHLTPKLHTFKSLTKCIIKSIFPVLLLLCPLLLPSLWRAVVQSN